MTATQTTTTEYGTYRHSPSGEVYFHKMLVSWKPDGDIAEVETIGICGPLHHDEADTPWADAEYTDEDLEWANAQGWTLLSNSLE